MALGTITKNKMDGTTMFKNEINVPQLVACNIQYWTRRQLIVKLFFVFSMNYQRT